MVQAYTSKKQQEKADGSHVHMGFLPCKVFSTRMRTDKGSVKILEQKAKFCQVGLQKNKYIEEIIKKMKK